MKRAKREFPGASAYVDRHGTRRWRYRSRGGFSAELGTDYGGPEFVRRYEAALKRQKGDGASLKHGTIAWLVASYYRSPAYRGLSESTRRVYRGVIERFREEHGDRMAATLPRRKIIEFMGRKADTPNAANFLLRMIRALMQHAVDVGLRDDDPTQNVRKFDVGGGGFHTWDEGEVARFEAVHPVGSTARLAFALMLHTGAARVDACRLGWQHIKGGRLRYRRAKTIKTTAMLIDIPVHPDLAAVLDTVPRSQMTFLQTVQGKPRSPNGLGNSMRRWCDEAGLPDCSSHGLRKACARRLAEAGCSPHEIQAVTGHVTLKEVERYTRAANRTMLADSAFEKAARSGQIVANHPDRFANNPRNPLKGNN